MKILDVLDKEMILVDLAATDKIGVLTELSEPAARMTGLQSADIVRVLLERERLGSTGIGDGIGIPHGKINNLDRAIMGFGLSRKGVPFESIDNRPAHLFFLLITPENATDVHLKLLARISRMLNKETFRQMLMNVTTSAAVMDIIHENDESF
ncbi:PTS sugar transporter subunit IIA [Desulfosarcina sp. OttesenSCG-928-A07]|nr:PTS sugar transporter subunit IIA [Desulfosarcina sp. OttesenSCG-928-G17]MDL2329536.1 PTS sugar transporter subunit IIA [Desulfosarcina sp. OttesenSCG-928-A07]